MVKRFCYAVLALFFFLCLIPVVVISVIICFKLLVLAVLFLAAYVIFHVACSFWDKSQKPR